MYTTGIQHHFVSDHSRDLLPALPQRLIPISILYPGIKDGEAAQYLDLFKPAIKDAMHLLHKNLEAGHVTMDEFIHEATSHNLTSYRDIQGDSQHGPFPVVLYSPGGGRHRFTNMPLLERLAASGYVVITMDHPKESPFVIYPGGQICAAKEEADFIDLTLERVRDTVVVLDYLDRVSQEEDFQGMMDLASVGMFGHSRGGYTSILAQGSDKRISAAGNLDGFLYAYPGKNGSTGIERWSGDVQKKLRESETPILRVRGRRDTNDADTLFLEDCADFKGDFNFVILSGWTHQDFETSSVLMPSQERGTLFRFQSPDRVECLLGVVKEFFDIYLRKSGTRNILGNRGQTQAGVVSRFRQGTCTSE